MNKRIPIAEWPVVKGYSCAQCGDEARTNPSDGNEWGCASFSVRNKARCEAANGFNHKISSWSLSDWMTATMGELGEAANIVKKLNRYRDGIPGNDLTVEVLRDQLADELADVVIYLDLLIQAAGLNLEAIRDAKFDRTSQKIGYVEPKCSYCQSPVPCFDGMTLVGHPCQHPLHGAAP